MYRNRNIYIEDFFGASGTTELTDPIALDPSTPTDPPPPPPPSDPVPELEPLPETELVTNGDSGNGSTDPLIEELQEIKDVLEDQNQPTYIVPPYTYPSTYPLSPLNPPVVTVPIVDTGTGTVVGTTTGYGGGYGGGFGGGAMEKQMEEEMGGAEKLAQPEVQASSKKNLLWLVLLAIAVYVAYRYFKKK